MSVMIEEYRRNIKSFCDDIQCVLDEVCEEIEHIALEFSESFIIPPEMIDDTLEKVKKQRNLWVTKIHWWIDLLVKIGQISSDCCAEAAIGYVDVIQREMWHEVYETSRNFFDTCRKMGELDEFWAKQHWLNGTSEFYRVVIGEIGTMESHFLYQMEKFHPERMQYTLMQVLAEQKMLEESKKLNVIH